MESLIESTRYKRTISWLANYIKTNPNADMHFRTICSVLRQEKNYYIKCVLLDNKYLYGSFLAAARESIKE